MNHIFLGGISSVLLNFIAMLPVSSDNESYKLLPSLPQTTETTTITRNDTSNKFRMSNAVYCLDEF